MFDWLIDGQSSCASIDYLKFLFAFGHLTCHVCERWRKQGTQLGDIDKIGSCGREFK